jgi:tetratricopeptide (TPR) repeat protein
VTLSQPALLAQGSGESESKLLSALEQAQSSGANNPNVTAALVALADFYRTSGKLDEAEQYNRRAIANNGDQFGAMAPGTLSALISLGATLRDESKYAEAELTLRNALVVASRQPTSSNRGGQFRDINIFCNNVIANPRMLQGTSEIARAYDALAELFIKVGRIQDAERLYERVLEIYGLQQPTTILIANNPMYEQANILKHTLLKLAEVYELEGKQEKAAERKQQAEKF